MSCVTIHKRSRDGVDGFRELYDSAYSSYEKDDSEPIPTMDEQGLGLFADASYSVLSELYFSLDTCFMSVYAYLFGICFASD